jgi:hypothetical protein
MRQTARRESFESEGSRTEPASSVRPSGEALKVFWRSQASQVIEKVVSARENPRKSKLKRPPPKALFATKPRLADEIQTAPLLLEGAAAGMNEGANFLPLSSCNPLKRKDRRRFTAENGGKRRRLRAGARTADAKVAKRRERRFAPKSRARTIVRRGSRETIHRAPFWHSEMAKAMIQFGNQIEAAFGHI